MSRMIFLLLTAMAVTTAAQPREEFDVLIKGGTVYDGTGAEPRRADVAIKGDRVAGVGDFASAKARTVIKADGMAVAPGFINMLSWSNESLIADGRSQSEIRQGVTTEIMGEGQSMGPLNEAMKKRMVDEQKDIKFEIKWNTLAEYLHYLETRGISCNVASFIGAATIREYVIGLEDKQPTPEQLEADARSGAEGNGSRRARHWVVADLSAGLLREDGGADRVVQSRGEVWRQIHFAYAERGESSARGARGIDSH